MDFLVRRDDLRECRFADSPAPAIEEGQALLEVDSFALTSNNVTYGVLGDALNYWSLFPAPEGWGRIPVWGFADVAASRHDGLEEGARFFGYLPPSSHLVVTPGKADGQGFVDATPHRERMADVYNTYARADNRRHEDQRMLLQPLVGTGLLVDAHLAESDFFGADTVLLSSASSKTALGTAFFLRRRGGRELIGLTSPARLGFVESVGVYDSVVPYGDVESLPSGPAVYVDISGDAAVRAAVHRHFGDSLRHSLSVGATHWDRVAAPTDPLPGPEPTFFFAPDALERQRDVGAGAEAMVAAFEWAAGWLEVNRGQGPEAVERAYRELLDGGIDPAIGHVLSLRP